MVIKNKFTSKRAPISSEQQSCKLTKLSYWQIFPPWRLKEGEAIWEVMATALASCPPGDKQVFWWIETNWSITATKGPEQSGSGGASLILFSAWALTLRESEGSFHLDFFSSYDQSKRIDSKYQITQSVENYVMMTKRIGIRKLTTAFTHFWEFATVIKMTTFRFFGLIKIEINQSIQASTSVLRYTLSIPALKG